MSDALDLYILKHIGRGRSFVLCSIDLCLAMWHYAGQERVV